MEIWKKMWVGVFFWTQCINIAVGLQVVIEQGGIQPGGLNFDAKMRRESIDIVDMFIAHIGLSASVNHIRLSD